MDVANDDPRAAGRKGRQYRDHADRPSTHDDGEIAGPHLNLGGRMDADGQWLDHRTLGVADIIRQLEGEVGGVDHALARSTPCTGGVAQKRTAGSRLYLPSRVARLAGSGIPGSMHTRSPGFSSVTADPTSSTSPAASWPRTIGSLTTNGPIAPCV